VKLLSRTWTSPKLSVCDSKRAARELNIYLKTLELTSQNKESFDSRLLYAIVQCEAALLLAGNDQNSLCAIGHRINYDDGKWLSMSGPLKDYAVYLADQVYGKIQQTNAQSPYLNRITARIKAGRYSEALQMIEEYERKGMREDEKSKDAMKAGLLFYFKKYEEALSAAEKSDDHYWCIYAYPPSKIIVEIKKKLAGKTTDPDSGLKAEYENLENKRVKTIGQGSFDAFQRWAFLARKFEKPESVLKKLLDSKTIDIGTPAAQIELAKAYIDTGEKEKAGRIIGRLSSLPVFKPQFANQGQETRFKELTSEGITPIPEQWETFGKIIPQKKGFKLYLRPIGKVDKAFAEKTSQVLGEFLGMEVDILPVANLPEESESYSRERKGYKIEWFWKSSMKAGGLPQDAACLILLTEENLVDGLWPDFFMFRPGIGGAVSYRAFKGGINSEESTAKVAASLFLIQCNNLMNEVNPEIFQKINIPAWSMILGSCYNYPCLMSCATICTNSQLNDFPRRKLSLCEDCQKRFSKINPIQIRNSFQKEMGRYRVELEKKNNKQ
jgi:predicted Zn-dependent protease